MNKSVKVAIIGGGPAGLGAAMALTEAGIGPICILEREVETGGASRHCGHPSFGFLSFKRIMTGPGFAAHLRKKAAGINIQTRATVTQLQAGGILQVSTPEGAMTINAERVIIATGAREPPRSMRLVSGMRPIGICTTGALQQFVYLKNLKPFHRPVIIGSEIVSFSAFWTLMRGKMKAVAMIESEKKCQAYWPAGMFPPLIGTPLHTATQIKSINGIEHVESITIQKDGGQEKTIECDGVIFSGQFIAENALIKNSCLEGAEGLAGPRTDQFFQCSDPAYFAAGNMLHPVELGDRCYLEGRVVAQHVINSLKQSESIKTERVRLKITAPLTVIAPSAIVLNTENKPESFRVKTQPFASGYLTFKQDGKILLRQFINGHADRFTKITGIDIRQIKPDCDIEVSLEKE